MASPCRNGSPGSGIQQRRRQYPGKRGCSRSGNNRKHKMIMLPTKRQTEKHREAKRTVAVERTRAAQELYEKVVTRKCEKAIYRLAKSRDRATNDNYQGYFVKAKYGTLLMNTEEIMSRWAEYYRDLLNKAQDNILTAETNH